MPESYLTAPSLSEDVMLNMTKVEVVSDADTCLFFEKRMRSLVSYISKRCSKANNKYLKFYDPKQVLKHIIHLDANNLYVYAMSKFLPTGGFKRIDLKELDLNKYGNNSSKGCVLEVDPEYSKELRELHNDYPLAPDKI